MNYDAYNRRERIKQILMERHKVTTGEFAEMFDVSKVTIAHDITVLSLRSPISSERGRNGGYTYTGKRKLVLDEEYAPALMEMLEFHERNAGDRRLTREEYDALKGILQPFLNLLGKRGGDCEPRPPG